jgi:hypothetical protein
METWVPISFGVFGVVIGFLFQVAYKARRDLKKLNDLRNKNMLEDLELATSDQLLGELRKRPGIPYLMLSPVSEEHHEGLSIEIHNIGPVPCLQMLQIATTLTYRELKSRGIELPEFPPPQIEGDEWKKE